MILLLAAAVGIGSATHASAQQVAATADTISVAEAGAFVDVQFRIIVTNGEAAAAANVFVVFKDGLEVYVGDVAAGASARTEPQTRTLDVSAMPTHNYPIPVTVKFSVDGVSVELAQNLVVRLGAPAGGGQ